MASSSAATREELLEKKLDSLGVPTPTGPSLIGRSRASILEERVKLLEASHDAHPDVNTKLFPEEVKTEEKKGFQGKPSWAHDEAKVYEVILAGVVNSVLLVASSFASGMIVFSGDWHLAYASIGIKMNLGAIMVLSLLHAIFCESPMSIAGPDIGVVVFCGRFTSSIAESLASQHGLAYPLHGTTTTTTTTMATTATTSGSGTTTTTATTTTEEPTLSSYAAASVWSFADLGYGPCQDSEGREYIALVDGHTSACHTAAECMNQCRNYNASQCRGIEFGYAKCGNCTLLMDANESFDITSSWMTFTANRTGSGDVSQNDPSSYGTGRCFRRVTAAHEYWAPPIDFCTGSHYTSHVAACDAYSRELIATTFYTASFAAATLAISFAYIGFQRVSYLSSSLPAYVGDSLNLCIGLQVLSYAIRCCRDDLIIFIPAAFIGSSMHFIRREEGAKSNIAFVIFFFLPLASWHIYSKYYFYSVTKIDYMVSAVADGSGFPPLNSHSFEDIPVATFRNIDHINYAAWRTTLNDLGAFAVLCALETSISVVDIAAATSAMLNSDFEFVLCSFGNVLVGLLAFLPGSMMLQNTKLGITLVRHSKGKRNRLVAVIVSIFSGAFFFLNLDLAKYMPRFGVGVVLFFISSELIGTHLMERVVEHGGSSWLQVVFILFVYIVTAELLNAMCAAAVCAIGSFLYRVSGAAGVAGRPLRGNEVASRERYCQLLERNIRHIAHSWLLIIKLRGYMYYPDLHETLQNVIAVLEKQRYDGLPKYRWLHYLIFDFALSSGMDPACVDRMQAFKKKVNSFGLQILWSNVARDVATQLRLKRVRPRATQLDTKGSTIDDFFGFACLDLSEDMEYDENRQELWFADIEDAVYYVELAAVRYRTSLQDRWLAIHPNFILCHALQQRRMSYDPFGEFLRDDASRFGVPWEYCERCIIRRHKSLLWKPGEHARELIIVHSGAVGLFDSFPQLRLDGDEFQDEDDVVRELVPPLAIYRHGWFLNREFIIGQPTKYWAFALEDGEVLSFTQQNWWKMSRDQPSLQNTLVSEVMRQATLDELRSDRMHRLDINAHNFDATASRAMFGPLMKVNSDLEPLAPNESEEEALGVSRGVRPPPQPGGGIPGAARQKLNSLTVAHRFFDLGFYEALRSDDEGYMPDVPRQLTQCFRRTFKHFSQPKTKGGAQLDFQLLDDAMMYAGVFDTLPCGCGADDAWTLSENDFVTAGCSGVMARLSSKQLQQVEAMFKQIDLDGNGDLEKDELVWFFNKMFMVQGFEEELQSQLAFWDSDHSDTMSIKELASLISRGICKSEMDWLMLSGLTELMGKRLSATDSHIDVYNDWLTIEDLIANSRGDKLNVAVAEELLWVAGLDGGTQDPPKSICIGLLIAALLFDASTPPRKLPAAAKQAEAKRESVAPLPPEALVLDPTDLDDEAYVDLEVQPQESRKVDHAQLHWAPSPASSDAIGSAVQKRAPRKPPNATQNGGGASGASGASGFSGGSAAGARQVPRSGEQTNDEDLPGATTVGKGQPERKGTSRRKPPKADSKSDGKLPKPDSKSEGLEDQSNSAPLSTASPMPVDTLSSASAPSNERAPLLAPIDALSTSQQEPRDSLVRKNRWRRPLDDDHSTGAARIMRIQDQGKRVNLNSDGEPMPIPEDMMLDLREEGSQVEAQALLLPARGEVTNTMTTAASPVETQQPMLSDAAPLQGSLWRKLDPEMLKNAPPPPGQSSKSELYTFFYMMLEVPGATAIGRYLSIFLALVIAFAFVLLSMEVTNSWKNTKDGFTRWFDACDNSATSSESSCSYITAAIMCYFVFVLELCLRLGVTILHGLGLRSFLREPLVACDIISILSIFLDGFRIASRVKYLIIFRVPRFLHILSWVQLSKPAVTIVEGLAAWRKFTASDAEGFSGGANISKLDRNNDGTVSKAEIFNAMDKNRDGVITKEEFVYFEDSTKARRMWLFEYVFAMNVFVFSIYLRDNLAEPWRQ